MPPPGLRRRRVAPSSSRRTPQTSCPSQRRPAATAGLIVVYREGDARKDMQIAEIAAAVDRVQERLGVSLTGKVVILNEHR